MADDITLRRAEPRDLAQVRLWLKRPDIQAWWGNASAADAEIALAFASPSAICCMIEMDGRAIGYAHAIDASYWGEQLPEGMPPGTYDLDLFIAEAAERGRGAGQAALTLLAREVFETTLAPAVSVFVAVSNERAVRAYEKAGFRWVRVVEDPIFGPCWLMLIERPAGVAPTRRDTLL